MTDVLSGLDIRPQLPARLDRPIGIVGAGAIVNAAHLPAYRSVGFNVVAIADIDRGAAEETARVFEIPRTYGSAEEMLSDESIEIVDIAVAPSAQPEIGHAAIAAGRHLLCQKPLAGDLSAARALVDAADAAGVRLAVNQQMRWEPVIRATRGLLDAGRYGTPAGAMYDIDIQTRWETWPWMAALDQLEYRYHSIHYFDSARFLFGEPASVIASVGKYPGQGVRGETRTFTILEYTETVNVAIIVNHNNWSTESRALIRFDGTEGRSVGRLGMLDDYPAGGPHSLSFVSRAGDPAASRTFEQGWIPDAFVGPMAELQLAIEQRREPLTSGRDNLGTLALVHAAYRSAAEGRRIELGDDMAS